MLTSPLVLRVTVEVAFLGELPVWLWGHLGLLEGFESVPPL